MTRGAWFELRAYREACAEVERVMAADPRDWVGCWNDKNQAIDQACRDRHHRWEEAQAWAWQLGLRVIEHAAADDPDVGTYLYEQGFHFLSL